MASLIRDTCKAHANRYTQKGVLLAQLHSLDVMGQGGSETATTTREQLRIANAALRESVETAIALKKLIEELIPSRDRIDSDMLESPATRSNSRLSQESVRPDIFQMLIKF